MRQFYVPDYTRSDDNTVIEDIRTTLYWNPNILVDKNNRRYQVQFYNNDISKKLRVILEGFNEEGKLCRIEKVLQ